MKLKLMRLAILFMFNRNRYIPELHALYPDIYEPQWDGKSRILNYVSQIHFMPFNTVIKVRMIPPFFREVDRFGNGSRLNRLWQEFAIRWFLLKELWSVNRYKAGQNPGETHYQSAAELK